MHTIKSSLRKFDYQPVPVSLNYKGEAAKGTVIGGICTIIAAFIIISFIISQLYQVSHAPNYKNTSDTSFIDQETNTEVYSIPNTEMTFAIRLIDNNDNPINDIS